jgi:methyl-accepting chemotaxis protein
MSDFEARPKAAGPQGSLRRRVLLCVGAGAAAGLALGLAVQQGAVSPRAGAVGGLGAAVGLLLLVDIQLRRSTEPLGRALSAVERIAAGEVSARVDPDSLGDVAAFGHALNALSRNFEDVSLQVIDFADRIGEVSRSIAGAILELENGSESQVEAVEETASLLANINTSIRSINGEVSNLMRSAEEVSASVLEMGASIEDVARSAASLHEAIDSSASSVDEMGANIRQVAENADEVQRMAHETATAMAEMDRATQEVDDHTREASELTLRVSQTAETGTRAVAATIEGIEEIRSQSREAKQVLERLAHRIEEIGEILDVIGGINDETNLLALNAAIIAAQAGEHGSAFAVVANQVKTLAQRTATSTRQIERLIRSVQTESANAVSAMGVGLESVEIGVERSRRAGESLELIRMSARDANTRVTEIARAAAEQARNSRYVAEAAQRTSGMVQQISSAMGEQSNAAARLLATSRSILSLCEQVHGATEEQKSAAHFITRSVEGIAEMIHSIQRNTGSHQRASDAVVEAVSRILEVARGSSARLPEARRGIESLRDDAAGLSSALAGIRVGDGAPRA